MSVTRLNAATLPLPIFRDVYADIVRACPRARHPAVPSVPLGRGPVREDVSLTPATLRPSWSQDLINTRTVGDCCAPHVPDGSIGLYDPSRSAHDGDYVLIVLHEDFQREWLATVAADRVMLQHYSGMQVPNVVAKQLRVIDGCAYACEALTAMPLVELGTVIGVLVHLEQP